jgi:hypothetical protein
VHDPSGALAGVIARRDGKLEGSRRYPHFLDAVGRHLVHALEERCFVRVQQRDDDLLHAPPFVLHS